MNYFPRITGQLAGAMVALHSVLPHAQGFGPEQELAPLIEAYSTLASDLDGDGDLDVLAGYGGGITWSENIDGLGTYGPLQVISGSGEVRSVAAADLDGDGDQDVISGVYPDTKIEWYENTNSVATFGLPKTIHTSALVGALAVAVADLDGDADFDVLSATPYDDSVAWYENADGMGSFGPQQLITTLSDGAIDVLATDLDGDGYQDVVSASINDDTIAWHRNLEGLGVFGHKNVISSSALKAKTVSASDLDGDGDQDVLSASIGSGVAWNENIDGAGTFGIQQPILSSSTGALSVLGADFDGDGDCDVLTGSYFMIEWNRNVDELGTFSPQNVISASTGAESIGAPDLDGDGGCDVLACISVFSYSLSWYKNILGLDCNGNGIPDLDEIAFGTSVDCNGNGAPDECDIAQGTSLDLDADGIPDECLPPPLGATLLELPLSSGGTQVLTIHAGPQPLLNLYLLMGSQSGTAPGIAVDSFVLPLNLDPYLLYTIQHPNSPALTNTLGILLPNGTTPAPVSFNLPPGLSPALAGSTLHHAYAVFDLTSAPGQPFLSFASNAVPLNLVP